MTVSGSWGVGGSAGGWGRRLSGAPRDIDPPTGRAIMVRTGISAGGGRRRHKAVYKLASGGRWSFVRTLAVPARLRTGSAEPPRCGRCGWAFTSRLMREQRPGNTAVRRHPRQAAAAPVWSNAEPTRNSLVSRSLVSIQHPAYKLPKAESFYLEPFAEFQHLEAV